MALLHEKLYQTDALKGVDFGGYLQSLAKTLVESYSDFSNNVLLVSDISPVVLGLEKATPCGLIVNEIISNSLKHAFPGDTAGEIQVSLSLDDSDPPKVVLVVADNGVGMPESIGPGETESLGLTVEETLTKQIKGDLTVERSEGTRYTLSFVP